MSEPDHPHDPDNSIRWSICASGHLHVDVLDAEEHVVASFVMSGDDAEHFGVELVGEVGRWRQFIHDTIEPVEGHA